MFLLQAEHLLLATVCKQFLNVVPGMFYPPVSDPIIPYITPLQYSAQIFLVYLRDLCELLVISLLLYHYYFFLLLFLRENKWKFYCVWL